MPSDRASSNTPILKRQSKCKGDKRTSDNPPGTLRRLNDAAKLSCFPAMRVPLLDLSEQYRTLAEPIRETIDAVLASHRFILGPQVKGFEKAISDYCNAPHAIGVSSGTDALLAILMALGIGRGDAVITTPFAFFSTAACIARVGAKPIFVDIDPATYNISPAALERFLDNECEAVGEDVVFSAKTGKLAASPTDNGCVRVRAILPAHLFGLCCEMDAIQKISERYQLVVIEDAAQAIGAEYRCGGNIAKAATMGKAGVLSFYPSKNLGAAGDAGMIICSDDELAKKLRMLREHGMDPRYHHHVIGGNFRLDEMQAAILSVKLPYLDNWSAARRAVADFYRAEFVRTGLAAKIALPVEPYHDRGLTNHHIYHQYIIRAPRRDALREHLARCDIQTAIYYPLGLHEQKCFAYLRHKKGDFPEAERAARETLALPIYPEISREAQRYVANAIVEFFG